MSPQLQHIDSLDVAPVPIHRILGRRLNSNLWTHWTSPQSQLENQLEKCSHRVIQKTANEAGNNTFFTPIVLSDSGATDLAEPMVRPDHREDLIDMDSLRTLSTRAREQVASERCDSDITPTRRAARGRTTPQTWGRPSTRSPRRDKRRHQRRPSRQHAPATHALIGGSCDPATSNPLPSRQLPPARLRKRPRRGQGVRPGWPKGT